MLDRGNPARSDIGPSLFIKCNLGYECYSFFVNRLSENEVTRVRTISVSGIGIEPILAMSVIRYRTDAKKVSLPIPG